MDAFKDGRYPVELDKTRHLLFSLNVLDEVTKRYGSIGEIGKNIKSEGGDVNIAELRWLLTLLLNEGADEGDPELTEKQVGRIIHAKNITRAISAIFSALSFSVVGNDDDLVDELDDEDDEADEIESKNVVAGEA